MGQAKPAHLRLQIVKGRQRGQSYMELALEHKVHYHTVRSICKAYEASGTSALTVDYSACGRPKDYVYERGYRLVRLLKQQHPTWGVPYITTRIKERYPELPMLSDRQLQRRLKAHLGAAVVPKAKLPDKVKPDRARCPHDEWQIDAKERILLQNGTEACYLNITDTKTNALLEAKAFSPCAD